ncbi:MAG TPA: hypothetical protein VIO83_09415 [Pseudomonas sp.]
MSKERPILFNGAMVRAILAGQKTQTRRVLKMPHGYWETSADGLVPIPAGCPFGQPGDRLWVRESFSPIYSTTDGRLIEVDYRATYQHGHRMGDHLGMPKEWKPSVHMPREACRLVLEITSVRVERLQALPSGDWESEGISFCIEDPDTTAGRAFSEAEHYWIAGVSMRGTPEDHAMRAHFAEQGLDWDSNPWVWVIDFKQVTP